MKFRREHAVMHTMCSVLNQASIKMKRRAQMYIDCIFTSFSTAKTPTILPNARVKRTYRSLAAANIARFKTYPVAFPSNSFKSKQQVVLLPYLKKKSQTATTFLVLAVSKRSSLLCQFGINTQTEISCFSDCLRNETVIHTYFFVIRPR